MADTANHSNVMGDVPEDVKYELCAQKMSGLSQNQLVNWLKTEHGISYDRSQVSRFFASARGVEMMSEAQQAMKEKWLNQHLATRHSRVNALVEEATKLKKKLYRLTHNLDGEEVEDYDTAEYNSISREYRAYLAQLNKELEPIKLTTEGDSPFDRFLANMATEDVTTQ